MKGIKDFKLKDIDGLKKMTIGKLKEEIKRVEKELFSLRMKLSLGELKQTHIVKQIKKYIAKANTLIVAKNK